MAEVSGRSGTKETEVILNESCEGGLGQQRNYGGGFVTVERVKSPGAYVTE